MGGILMTTKNPLMKCPIDGSLLRRRRRRNMPVDECPKCKGMWLTPLQLDQLEDRAFDVDEMKGSVLVSSVETSLPCPVCHERLLEFNYRYHQLRLDHCPRQHGFWLDHSEDTRVLEIMTQRERDASRKLQAEATWAQRVRSIRWFIFTPQDSPPVPLRRGRKARRGKDNPRHIDVRPPAIPFRPPLLPATCPKCGGPVNAMTVIEDSSHRFSCGYCHASIQPLNVSRSGK
jgi:Zn-finger nucleic acid-binding protein